MQQPVSITKLLFKYSTYAVGLTVWCTAIWFIVTLVSLGWPVWIDSQFAKRYNLNINQASCTVKMQASLKDLALPISKQLEELGGTQ